MTTTDRLSALDVSFLHMERPGVPIHVASVAVFEGAPLLDPHGALRLDEIRTEVDARLDSLPRLRRRLAWAPLGLARPCWVDDAAFDIARHVDAVDVDGDEDALRRYAEALVVEPLPRDRPLWHLRFVTGLSGGRVGLIERVHHALVDGVSGVDVAAILLDLAPDVRRHAPSAWRAEPPSSTSLLVDAVRSRLRDPLGAARAVGSSLVHPTRLGRGTIDVVTGLGTVAGDGVLAPRSSLNVPVGATRHLRWISADLDAVKATGRPHGATANDVVLSAIAEGLRDVLLLRGEVLAHHDWLKVLVPVSLRDADSRGTLGNEVGALVVRLPIGIGDPAERLRVIAATTARAKRRREATTTAALLAAAALIPPRLIGPIVGAVHQQRLVNLVVTNVPGPPCPLYANGARMLEVFPVVPLGGNLTVGVAILSYDGVLNLGITADAEGCPDVDRLCAGIERGLAGAVAARSLTAGFAWLDHSADAPPTVSGDRPAFR